MTDKIRAVFLPANKQLINIYKGYILNGELLNKSEKDLYTEIDDELDYDNPSKIDIALRVIFILPLFPFIIVIAAIASIFNKGSKTLDKILPRLNRVVRFLSTKKKTKRKKQVLKKEYEDIFKEDIPAFLNHCKKNLVTVYLYSYDLFSEEDASKVEKLIQEGHINSCAVISKLSDLVPLLAAENISLRNSLMIITNTTEKSEANLLGFYTGNGDRRNVHLWGDSDFIGGGEIEWNSRKALCDLKDKVEYYLKGKANPFLSNNLILFIEDAHDPILNNYILRNHESVCERLKGKGFEFIYFPSFQSESSALQKIIVELIKYRLPVLNSLADNEIEYAISTILNKITPKEFYEMVIQDLDLPYFKKPSLLRNISEYNEEISTFTYKTIEYQTETDLDKFFNWYIEQIKVSTANNKTIYYSLAQPPADYDADWYFNKDSKEESEELKKKIDAFKKEGKYGALVEAIMYMLETIKEDKPEIIDKVKPLLEKRKLLESNVTLSPLVIDKHNNIFLPAYGNIEVKMHALPKTVYLLFLRYPNGIRFKELYEYKAELLEIYNKVTNKYEKAEIERAIDDLVDMTKPSINQKCARIREAFRNIMDEHIAKHYYIDGSNGEPKSIALPRDLITIQK
ncbi:MAG TPA: hypothetical protein PKL56_16165 [Cyclobacteriaceae bacterium]|nr:hypothetical protein [Cyclobacteriaceae bacterium]HMX88072.1 hypothetical protein [Saprospiraceae bacterium]HMX00905.1 hypothetical protein [Cyclobacteriaceae bacterium]HMY93709.1 hypothetical protein [Cyclobacteriaceae bacterium]HNA12857.1 hypothetical protein [Cyclobacteriaceae bacterium]